MRKITLFFIGALLTVLLFPPQIIANENFCLKKEEKKTEKDPTEAKENAYEKIIKNPEQTSKGFVNLYYKKGKLYFEVPFSLMEKPMLLGSTISQLSDNNNSYVGTKPFNPLMVEFVRVDSTLQLRRLSKYNIAPEEDRNIQKALDKNSIGAIMQLFKIKAYNPDTTAAVIEVSDLFLKDIKELSPFGGAPRGFTRSESFKKDRSFIGEIKSFEDNLTVKSTLSYEYSLSVGKRSYFKNKPFTAVMTRTLLLLPEKPARPRLADPRIAIFISKKYKFTNDENRTKAEYYAHRFNLLPSDTAAYMRGELVDPVKPIVFYVDSDLPKSWRETVKGAVEDWNVTFEKIGFKNVMKALDFPKNNPDFDPDNLKYNCVRYLPTPVANAMGPSWVDPRSGEIINASVYVFHDVVKLINRWMFVQLSPSDKNLRDVKLPEEYRNNALRYVLRHEVGHCLGFMHNMAASSSIPVDSLRSPSFTQKYGTTYSIMDYARFNYVAQPGDKERGVKLTPPMFGLYDYFTIKWNYTFFPEAETKEEEAEKLDAMISEKAGDIRYRYGKQQGYILDPSSQSEDLGDNAVVASTYGIKNLKYVMNHLNEWVESDDKDYSYRTSIWTNIVTQYVRYINHIYSNVGGIYLNERYEGDPRPFYKSVPVKRQKDALEFLLNEAKNLDWIENKEVLENMSLTGTPAKVLRKKLIAALLASVSKVNLSAEKSEESNPFTPKECMEYIYNAVWENVSKKKEITAADKDMQKAFVTTLIKGAGFQKGGTGKKNAFADNNFLSGITLPECIAKKEIKEFGYIGFNAYLDPCPDTNNELVCGYGLGTTINFNIKASLEDLYYKTLIDTKSVIKQCCKRSKDNDTKLHYELLLYQIEKSLN